MMITGCASCWVPLSRLPHSAIALHLYAGKRPNFGRYQAGINNQGQLAIHDPSSRWEGWLCDRAASEQWPDDELQFLDYTRYPWLSRLIEDGPSIMQYREPKQYQEWLKSRPR